MKKILLFALFLCCNIFSFAQNNKEIYGKVQNIIDSSPISDVKISIFEREVTYAEDGLPILHKKDYKKPILKLISRNDGTFKGKVSFNSEKAYYYVLIEKNNYIKLHKDILIIDIESDFKELLFKLQSKSLNTKEEFIVEQILEREFDQKNIEKAQDPIEAPFYEESENQEKILNDNCTYNNVPTNVYVKYLHNGYNGSNSNSGFTGYIDFDEYIAGVVKAEIAGITTNLNVKKAQAVAARTYSMNKHLSNNPVNIGQAYKDTYDSGTLLSSTETTKEIILYNNQVINAIYAARCNGDFTQNAHEGVWSPYSSCNTSGNYVPYLISKPCSGHNNCSNYNESPCCSTQISSTGNSGYIYGHGVGLCQRGVEQWGEIHNKNYCEIIKKYYHNVCIANTDCSSNSSLLNCNSAIPLQCGVSYHGSSASGVPSYVSSYGCNNWTETGPERVHKFTAPSSGTLSVSISNFSGDLDVYILDSCDPQDCVGQVYSSHAVLINAVAGKTYYMVVDSDDGSTSSYDIIVNCNSLSVSKHDQKTFSIYPNPTKDILNIEASFEVEKIIVFNTLGKKQPIDIINSNQISTASLPKGIYILQIIDRYGNSSNHNFIKK
ncbi:T9SS type A sorting domain-containing protein [Aureivirga marina]|uniref:T9SS type A sorting domain-containing protein n=1 Tax=Aureivirga marina TaxID=1182451 RepID=UPI0018C8DFC4|nr:T9SS type A sorting domain-containing protein [Aureivirga marina]